QNFRLDEGTSLIGRDGGAAVLLDSLGVSRQHACIYRDGMTFVVEDLGSTNGTYLNGHRITGRRPVTVHDTLQIGPYVLALRPAVLEQGGLMMVRAMCSIHGAGFVIVFRERASGGWLAGRTFKRTEGHDGQVRNPGLLKGVYADGSYAGCPHC